MNFNKIDAKLTSKMKFESNSGDIFDSLSSSISTPPFFSGILKGSSPSPSDGTSKVDLEQLVKSDAISSIFSSVKKGVQTGVSAAVKVGMRLMPLQ